ncbi:MAG: 30S ribosomal protein S4e [Methanoregula sp.]|jgi:small subunit ribosomal protein S4e|uniref:30S ribosomal protein S4e n=1 Tax=Methanoregula sp. TaxID=2052170 RepID=UPI0025E4A720|nr:30S ribosomal protein S4e [Methanoregula sp.]MCK9632804.1 30S ribosomal protein S4e [Methanoregula sp.]
MSDHLKRLNAPDSWHIAKKTTKFITKTAPGPHNANAMPIAVWLRDNMNYARNMKEVKQILSQKDVIINGKPCRDPKMGVGIFDIIAMPKINKYYRILRDRNGRHISVEIDAEAAKSRLVKIRNKTTITGGKVQLNLRDGANILADNSYKPGDSVEVSLEPETRFKILDHFPFQAGNMAMIIGGKHSGNVARIIEIIKMPGSVPNKIILEDETTGTKFDTIAPYIYMVGKQTSAVAKWGHEE